MYSVKVPSFPIPCAYRSNPYCTAQKEHGRGSNVCYPRTIFFIDFGRSKQKMPNHYQFLMLFIHCIIFLSFVCFLSLTEIIRN